MGDNGDRPSRSRAGGASEGSREIVVSAILVGATVAILGAGAVLRSGPERERAGPAGALSSPPAIPVEAAPSASPAPAPPEAPVPAASPSPRALAPPPAADAVPKAPPAPPSPELATLARRAAADVARIGRARGRFTAQILVACRPETVTRLTAKVSAGAPLYVLPVEIRGEACFRVCWGDYTTADAAARARDLPAALASGEPRRAVEIVKVLP